MANWENLKESVNEVIKTNGNQEITGQVMQDVLDNVIDNLGANYSCKGVAYPSTNPSTPDGNVYYFAWQSGTYSNFGGIVLDDTKLHLLMWNGSAWQNVVVAMKYEGDTYVIEEEIDTEKFVTHDELSSYNFIKEGDSRLTDARTPTAHTHVKADITDFDHTHSIANVVGLQSALDAKANVSHTHTESEVENLVDDLEGKSDVGHTHVVADITDLQSKFDSITEVTGFVSDKRDEGDTITLKTSDGNYEVTIPFSVVKTFIDSAPTYTWGLLSDTLASRLWHTLYYVNDVATTDNLPTLATAKVGKTYRVKADDNLYICLQSEGATRSYSATANWRGSLTETNGGIDYYTPTLISRIFTNSNWTYDHTTGGMYAIPVEIGSSIFLAVCTANGTIQKEGNDPLIYVIDENSSPLITAVNGYHIPSTNIRAIEVNATIPSSAITKYWYIIDGASSTTDIGKDESDTSGSSSGDSGGSSSDDSGGSSSGDTITTDDADAGFSGDYYIYIANDDSNVSSLEVAVLDSDESTELGAWTIAYGGKIKVEYSSSFYLIMKATTSNGNTWRAKRVETSGSTSSVTYSISSGTATSSLYVDTTRTGTTYHAVSD